MRKHMVLYVFFYIQSDVISSIIAALVETAAAAYCISMPGFSWNKYAMFIHFGIKGNVCTKNENMSTQSIDTR